MKTYFHLTTELALLAAFEKENVVFPAPVHLCPSDRIVFLVHNCISAIADVQSITTEAPFQANISFVCIWEPSFRLPLLGEIRHALMEEWVHPEEAIKSGSFLTVSKDSLFYQLLESLPDSLAFYLRDLSVYMEEAQKQEDLRAKQHKKKNTVSAVPKETYSTDHTKAQHLLKELAAIIGCDIWTASNDKEKRFKGERLGEDDLAVFPAFPLDAEAKKRIALIDTLWFKSSVPLAAFEIECTTSVYSGILRMGDLISVLPNQHIQLFIIAPRSRKNKVLKELNRPLFQKIGLSQYCQFISIEDLELLVHKIRGLNGYIKETILHTISLSAAE